MFDFGFVRKFYEFWMFWGSSFVDLDLHLSVAFRAFGLKFVSLHFEF